MRVVFIGFALATLFLLVGCNSLSTPALPVESNQLEVQSEKSSTDLLTNDDFTSGVDLSELTPIEIPLVRETFRLPLTLDEGEDVTVYVQKVGLAEEVLVLSPYETSIMLQTLRHTKWSESTDWIEEEPSGPQVIIVIEIADKVYETSFYYEENVLSSSNDSPEGKGYLHAYNTQLSQIFYELFES